MIVVTRMKIVFIGANNPETIRMINSLKKTSPNFEVKGFLDNDPKKIGSSFYGYPVLGDLIWAKNLNLDEIRFVNLITRDCVTRYNTSKVIKDMGGKFCNFIHPSVNLEMVKLGSGIYIQENVVTQAEVEIGDNSSIHIGTLVGHETKIGKSTFIAHACSVSGCVNIGNGVFMGTGAKIIPRLKIGDGCIIGAGSVVIKDLPPFSVAVGSPAKVIRTLDHTHFEMW